MLGYPGENSIRYKEKIQRIGKKKTHSCIMQHSVVFSEYCKQTNKGSIPIDTYPQERIGIIILYNGRNSEDDYKECIYKFHFLLFRISLLFFRLVMLTSILGEGDKRKILRIPRIPPGNPFPPELQRILRFPRFPTDICPRPTVI